ncbi:branched-chain amino acid ABC transporter permease [Ancylobacter sonchi]|uniref:branched-chain amino acid ABC transporter permease n=1 Tax=Ancylobacter sonchi TaxID=1937790 RepID=UPI001BD24F40|nr:branched-chain amino acid ABC transporter permease [Ancylobacter sonchi]MBS7533224.1 branched-chain amino acid ABC transporter permease [Ancylobacter sonchi]
MNARSFLAALSSAGPALSLLIPLGGAVLLLSFTGSMVLEQAAIEALIKIVAVVGLYIFIGNSGIMSFGHVAFMAIGAYAAAWQTCCEMLKPIVMSGLPDILLRNTVPNFPASLASGALAAVAALAAGLVILRLNGIAASIASFALLFIINVVYSNADRYTQGVGSIVGLPTYVTPMVGYAWVCVTVACALLYQTSRFGLALRASREDEPAARAAGVNVYLQRLIAFVISAAFLGIAGALYGSLLGTISVDTFFLDMTFMLIAMLVIGGVRSLSGAVAGVVVISTVVELFRRLQGGVDIGGFAISMPAGAQGVALALFMLAMLIFRRGGLVGDREIDWVGPLLRQLAGRSISGTTDASAPRRPF